MKHKCVITRENVVGKRTGVNEEEEDFRKIGNKGLISGDR